MQIVKQNVPLKMTSLEISELTGKRHDNVRRTIAKLVAAEIIQLPQIEEVKNHLGQAIEVDVFEGETGKRDSIIVVARLSPTFTARLVDRWQELEQAIAIPRTMSEALQLAADHARLIEQQAPLVEFAEAVMARGQDMSLTAAGKELGFGQRDWFEFLREHKLITKRTYHPSRNRLAEFNEASSGMVAAGYMVVRHEPDVNGIPRQQTFVTSAGLDWLRKLVTAHVN